MKIIPAIDLIDGKAVRLRKGVRTDVTIYHDHPEQLVAEWIDAGAERIHVVDLDGAFDGARRHADVIARICAASRVPVQVGGGIRDAATARAVLDAGAAAVVLGTAAVKSPTMVRQLCEALTGRIVVAVDALDGMVAVEGWVEASTVSAIELGQQAAAWGAAALLYTDVARDGTGAGPNVAATAALAAAVSIDVIASGGVASLDHLRALAAVGLPSVVVGRALYDRAFTLPDAIAAARGAAPC
jgi:phosphoribosylformimino-5-aminoimidazole carboxamide ribotide isomerase